MKIDSILILAWIGILTVVAALGSGIGIGVWWLIRFFS